MKYSYGKILSIILINSIPVFGLLFYHWGIFSLVLIFGLENIVLCLFALLVAARIRVNRRARFIKYLVNVGFCVFFTAFLLVLNFLNLLNKQLVDWRIIFLSLVVLLLNSLPLYIKELRVEREYINDSLIFFELWARFGSLITLLIFGSAIAAYSLSPRSLGMAVMLFVIKPYFEILLYVKRTNTLTRPFDK